MDHNTPSPFPKAIHLTDVLGAMERGDAAKLLTGYSPAMLERFAEFAEALVNVACTEQERRGLITSPELSEDEDFLPELEERCMGCLGHGQTPSLVVENYYETCRSCGGAKLVPTAEGKAMLGFLRRQGVLFNGTNVQVTIENDNTGFERE